MRRQGGHTSEDNHGDVVDRLPVGGKRFRDHRLPPLGSLLCSPGGHTHHVDGRAHRV
jgi:hypothetical protein